MKVLNNYRKKIKRIVNIISEDVIKELKITFFERFFYKRNFRLLFYKNEVLNYLTTYFYMFDNEIEEDNEKIIEIIMKYFIIYYFSKFVLKKKKNYKKHFKNTLKLFQSKYEPKINDFFIKNDLKIVKNTPVFKQKTNVNWSKFLKDEIFVFANFFELFLKKIKGFSFNEENKKLGYKLGFSLGMSTFSSVERKKYEFLFLKRFNPTNKIKTDLFFVKLFFWTQLVSILRLFLPYKFNSFVLILNQQIGS